MNLHHLRHFMALSESRSLHQAARRLNLRQPSLSQSIRILEAHVGTLLVERSPTGTQLTPAGATFLTEIGNVLTALNRAVQAARQAARTTRPMRLGITSDTMSHQLVEILPVFRNSLPETPLFIDDGSSAQLLSMLDAKLLDLALLPAAATLSHTGGAAPLWSTPLHLALPASHPLSTEPAIALDRLAEEPMILGTEQNAGSADQLLLTSCQAEGISPSIIARVHDLKLRLMLVWSGAGITPVPSPLSGLDSTRIVFRPVSPALSLEIAAAWPATGLTEAAQRLLDLTHPPTRTENHPPATHPAAPE